MGKHLFAVGDVKQSIYSFRGADTDVFAGYKKSFIPFENSENSDNALIFMSNNFRCDKSIIDFTNLICSRIFSTVSSSIGYSTEDDLKFSKISPEDHVSVPVNISIIQTPSRSKKNASEDADGDDVGSNKEIEAEYIASEIERLLKSGTKKANGEPLRAGDIAVLFRSSTIAPFIAEALKKRGILSNQADAKKYFENPDVLMMLCILNTIDNPERDTYLAGTLRSPIFDFEMEELITLRIAFGEPCSLY
jgi:ATP-dependent helicase/nuclease subunit A